MQCYTCNKVEINPEIYSLLRVVTIVVTHSVVCAGTGYFRGYRFVMVMGNLFNRAFKHRS